MAMHGDLSPQARTRAHRTVDAAGVFADHAEVIVAALPDVPDGHVLVAVVDDGHGFGGTHHVPQDGLAERVPSSRARAAGRWSSPRASSSPTSAGAPTRWRRWPRRRREMIDRILAKRNR